MSEKYPLWCIDTGEVLDRFIGPFGGERDAASRIERMVVRPPDVRIRKCRATSDRMVTPSLLGSFAVVQTYVCEGDE
jgi:hypothetical protein